jgi:hypothetical protein
MVKEHKRNILIVYSRKGLLHIVNFIHSVIIFSFSLMYLFSYLIPWGHCWLITFSCRFNIFGFSFSMRAKWMWCLLYYLICFTTCWSVQATAQGSVSSFRQAASMPPVLSVQLSRPSHTRWMCRELHGLAKIARAERILPQFCLLAPCGPLPELPTHLLC